MKGGLVGWGKPCPLGTVKGPEGVSPGEERLWDLESYRRRD